MGSPPLPDGQSSLAVVAHKIPWMELRCGSARLKLKLSNLRPTLVKSDSLSSRGPGNTIDFPVTFR